MVTLKAIRGADLWAMVPGIVTGVAAFAISMAVARWFGFFLMIDGKLMGLMSLQDIVANSLAYLPFSMFALILSGFFHLARGGKPVEAPRWMGFIYSGGQHPWRSLAWNLATLVVFALISANWPFAVMFYAFWVYFSVADIIEAYGLWLRNRYVPEFVTGAFMVVTQVLLGISSAYNLPDQPNYEVTTSGGSQQIVLLAQTHDFVLVKLASNQVSAIANAEVKSITQLQPQPKERKALVPLFDWVGDAWNWAASRLMGLFGSGASPAPPSPSSGP